MTAPSVRHPGTLRGANVTRSLTVRLPSVRQLALAAVAIVAIAVIVFLGVRLGSQLASGGAVSLVAVDGGIQEIHILGGAVYVGRITSDADGAIRVAGPALVLSDTTSSPAPDSGGQRLVVRALFTDPYDLQGDVLIPRDQVVLVGNITPGSSLEAAYLQAVEGVGPSGSPAPSG
jgi:hypothetical protein